MGCWGPRLPASRIINSLPQALSSSSLSCQSGTGPRSRHTASASFFVDGRAADSAFHWIVRNAPSTKLANARTFGLIARPDKLVLAGALGRRLDRRYQEQCDREEQQTLGFRHGHTRSTLCRTCHGGESSLRQFSRAVALSVVKFPQLLTRQRLANRPLPGIADQTACNRLAEHLDSSQQAMSKTAPDKHSRRSRPGSECSRARDRGQRWHAGAAIRAARRRWPRRTA